ncbi:MAG: hypothetical protein Q7R73_00465 [bacterium]|nr:hypothetical protein [bacterium]
MWRTRRQLTALLIIVLVVGGIGFLFVRNLLPEPTCFDNRKNQGEEDTDCGGSCLPCIFRNRRPIQVFWTRVTPVRGGVYAAVAEVKNPNNALGISEFEYLLKLFDDKDALVIEKRGTSFLYADEVSHVVETNLRSERPIVRGVLEIGRTDYVIRDDNPPDLIAGEKELLLVSQNGGTTELKARLFNRTLNDFRAISVHGILLDQSQNVLAVSSVLLDEVRGGEAKEIRFFWPGEIKNVSVMLVEPRVNTLTNN